VVRPGSGSTGEGEEVDGAGPVCQQEEREEASAGSPILRKLTLYKDRRCYYYHGIVSAILTQPANTWLEELHVDYKESMMYHDAVAGHSVVRRLTPSAGHRVLQQQDRSVGRRHPVGLFATGGQPAGCGGCHAMTPQTAPLGGPPRDGRCGPQGHILRWSPKIPASFQAPQSDGHHPHHRCVPRQLVQN
jgi:hypothetical protein